MHRISCYTLFDITRTGVLNRAKPGEDVKDISEWYRNRNTQCNFDTIIQVISLRGQPDIITYPERNMMLLDECDFGFTLTSKTKVPVWHFVFEVSSASVFEDGISDMGALYKDCQGVPMISADSHWNKAGDQLDITLEKRNIYFVK